MDSKPNAATIGMWVHEELHQRHQQPGSHHQTEPVIEDRPDDPSTTRAVMRHLDVCPGQDGARYLGGELDLRWFNRGKLVLLTGRVDALWEHDNGLIEVRDYKTGSAAAHHERADDPAIEVYALLAAVQYPGRPIRVTYEFLGDRTDDNERLHSIDVTVDLLRAARHRIERTAEMIRKEQQFAATPDARQCPRCPYQERCVAYRTSSNPSGTA
jgi:hypothetical protein